MSGKKVGVFGIYSTRIAAENATDSLMKAGFPASDISVLLPESLGGPKDMGTEKATKSARGCGSRRDHRWRNWWHARPAGRCWSFGDSWPRPIHRRGSDHGRAGGAGRWGSSGRSYRRLDRRGYP